MKRMYVLLLAMVLLLAGCGGKTKTKDISAKDVSCPYEINHKKDTVEITLRDGAERGLLWNVEALPTDVCEVTQEKSGKDDVCKYRINGLAEGASHLTFTAQQEDQTIAFSLEVIASVDSEGKVTISDYRHKERSGGPSEEESLDYRWDVDENGILTFSFFNSDDRWSVRGDGKDVCVLSDLMSMPSGCQFSAQAQSDGKISVLLIGKNTKRTIHVTLQVEDGVLEVISVQEQ